MCRMKSFKYIVFTIFFFSITVRSDGQSPELVENNGHYTLMVDGEPFIVMGAQLWNSSAWPLLLNDVWEQLKDFGCNTIEAPIYWQNIESTEGEFNFKEMDQLILGARKHNMRLVLLWFGSFKNGRMQYAPTWVIENTRKYPRMVDDTGQEIFVLSTLEEANVKSDSKAFTETMKHLKEIDGKHHTVIMVQVENEPGSMWTDRDYSDKANKLFFEPVPAHLASGLNKPNGTWIELFGRDASESFAAFHLASYINRVTKSGKNVYQLPMYVNAWILENGFEYPGEYPSGGPNSKMMDIWKVAAPDVDLLALDIYHSNSSVFLNLCEKYRRTDNPLFISEMGHGMDFARLQFHALGDFYALGVATYGIDSYEVDPHDKRELDKISSEFDPISDNYVLLGPAMSEIAKLQAAGNLKAAVEDYGLTSSLLHFDNYDVLIKYGYPCYKDQSKPSGRALIGQITANEFYIFGFDVNFSFRPTYGSGFRSTEYVMVEEGTFVNGEWTRKRIWNGDALYHSTLPSEGALLKVRLRPVSKHSGDRAAANFDK